MNGEIPDQYQDQGNSLTYDGRCMREIGEGELNQVTSVLHH